MRCAWPKSCGEVPDVNMGMLRYCLDHAIEVEKNRHTIIGEHRSYRPNVERHARWVKAQAEAKRNTPPEAEKKKDTVGMFWQGIARHDEWRAAQAALTPEEKVLI
jgi:hypothetical protein